MTRHLLFAIGLIAAGVVYGSRAEAATALQCEDRAVTCGARCTDVTGGAGDARGHQNRCIQSCARRVAICLSHAPIRSNRYARR